MNLGLLLYYMRSRLIWIRTNDPVIHKGMGDIQSHVWATMIMGTKDIRRLQLPVYLVEEWVDAIRGKRRHD